MENSHGGEDEVYDHEEYGEDGIHSEEVEGDHHEEEYVEEHHPEYEEENPEFVDQEGGNVEEKYEYHEEHFTGEE